MNINIKNKLRFIVISFTESHPAIDTSLKRVSSNEKNHLVTTTRDEEVFSFFFFFFVFLSAFHSITRDHRTHPNRLKSMLSLRLDFSCSSKKISCCCPMVCSEEQHGQQGNFVQGQHRCEKKKRKKKRNGDRLVPLYFSAAFIQKQVRQTVFSNQNLSLGIYLFTQYKKVIKTPIIIRRSRAKQFRRRG